MDWTTASKHVLNDTGLRPLKDFLYVRRDEAIVQKGSLFVPQGLEEWPLVGTVLAVGPDVKDPDVVPGARVLFKNKASSALYPDSREGGMKPEWERVVKLPFDHIMGVVEESP